MAQNERLTGIVIAAGSGTRMGALTQDKPKCMLPIGERPLLDYTVDALRAIGCTDIVVIVGYRAEAINVTGVEYVSNDDFRDNNILHSLMKAREFLAGPVVISYSDIWTEPRVYEAMAATPGDIVVAVDQDWRPYYQGRTQHPLSEAEKVHYDRTGSVVRIGKHLDDIKDGCGEFIGLWRMSGDGTEMFKDHFLRLEERLDPEEAFQASKKWRLSYITDMFQELVDQGRPVNCALFERSWAELDTIEDYERLPELAKQQRLITLMNIVQGEQEA